MLDFIYACAIAHLLSISGLKNTKVAAENNFYVFEVLTWPTVDDTKLNQICIYNVQLQTNEYVKLLYSFVASIYF